MNKTKKDIAKNISEDIGIPISESKKIIDSLLALIKENSKSHIVKIKNFGSFSMKETPQRKGRNPKTKECYTISKRYKLSFKTSNHIKQGYLN